MRAFITGASGFVGQHLVAHLRAAGDEVVESSLDLDIGDEDGLTAALETARPDVVYHLAGWAHVGESWRDPVAVHRVNVIGTAALMSAVNRIGSRPRTLVVGSAEAYGDPEPGTHRLTEDQPLRPRTPYGASKAAAEAIAGQAWRAWSIPVVLTRSFAHTGPGQAPTFLVPALARRVVAAREAGQTEVPVGNLDPVRDLLDVADVVAAYRLLLLHGAPGSAYNVCSGRGVAVRHIATRLFELAGPDLRLVQDPALMRADDTPTVIGDPTRLARATGWEPSVPLDETLRRVLASAERDQASLATPSPERGSGDGAPPPPNP